MKKKLFTLLILFSFGALINTYGQCTTGSNSFTTFTPTCTGSVQNIGTINSYRYATINVTAGFQYTFSTSISTDFITLTTTANVALASGLTQVTYTPVSSGQIRMYVHTSNTCPTSSSSRTWRVQCSEAPKILWSENFTATSPATAATSGWTRNSGTTFACVGGDFAYYSSGSTNFFATNTFRVPRGKGVSINFDMKRSSGNSTLEVYARVGGYGTFYNGTLSNRHYSGWMQLNTSHLTYGTSCSNFTVTVPSEICGGQNLSIAFRATGTNISMDNIVITDAGPSDPVPNISSAPLTYNFDSNANFWGPVNFNNFQTTATGNKFSYRSSYGCNNSSGAYAYITSVGGNGGQVNLASAASNRHVAFMNSTVTDCSGTPANSVSIITREFNTSGCSGATATLRFAFKSVYNGYTSNEEYTLFTPRVFYAVTHDGPGTTTTWNELNINYYFPNGVWWYATAALPKEQNLVVAFVPRAGRADDFRIDDIKIVCNDCSISNQMGGIISCTSHPGASEYTLNQPYTFTIGATTGATHWKWIVRDLTTSGNPIYYGTTAGATPAIVSGQGTQTVTINFGTNTGNSYRVICIPYNGSFGTDASPTDACYAKLSFYQTMTQGVSCNPVTISTHPSSPSSVCSGNGIAQMTVSVNGTANFNYQWQIFNGTWENLSNGGIYGNTAVTTNSSSTSNTLTITNADISMNGKQFRCVVTNCDGANSVNSNAATLAVNTEIVPTFTALGPYEQGATPASLSSTSNNGITGMWSPPAISTASSGTFTYNFTPDMGECAFPTSMQVTILAPNLTCATIVTPINGATNTELSQAIEWTVVAGAEYYELYFGTTNPPPFYENTLETVFIPNLNYATTYYWKVIPKAEGIESSECSVWSFETKNAPIQATLTWEGTVSSDWNNPANWNNSVVPTAADAVIIPANYTHEPIIFESKLIPAMCNDLEIVQDAVLTINDNKALTVKGDLSNDGEVRIKSSASGDGSIIIDGSISGNGLYKVERYFTGNTWHMMSSPITSATASVFQNIWVREYNESSNSWGAFLSSTSAPLHQGKGYAVWTYEPTETRVFNGIINHGEVIIPDLSLSGNPSPNQGWNLIGNPYPSAINWNVQSGWDKTGIANTLYIFSPATGNYVTWNGLAGSAGSGKLSMGQGFFVHAISLGAAITINNNARLHDEIEFRQTENVSVLSVEVSAHNYSDKTLYMIANDASDNFDYQYDAVKLVGIEEAPKLYSRKHEQHVAMHSIRNEQSVINQIVYLEVDIQGEYSLYMEHNFKEITPLLYDRLKGVYMPADQVYHFEATPHDIKERFVIYDYNAMDVPVYKINQLHIWEHNKIVHVQNINHDEIIIKTEVINILGGIVVEDTTNLIDLHSLPAGVYVVKVQTNQRSQVKKISIQ